MIVTETLKINDEDFIRTYSDENRYVVRNGESYEEAVDPAIFQRSYTEGDFIVRSKAPDIENVRHRRLEKGEE